MPIQFTCPHCGRQTEVSDEYAGQSGPCAGCGATITVPLVGIPFRSPPGRSSAPVIIVILAIIGTLSALVCCGAGFFFWSTSARGPDRRAACMNNLRSIGIALLQYEARYGQFPPAYIVDKDGRPTHSWRVLILPYLGEIGLHERYRFDEPWDSPNNLAVAAHIPTVYRCPEDLPADADTTSYMMIVGPGRIFDRTTSHNLGQIQDGPSNTILVVEAAESGVKWTQPDDLDAGTLSFEINDYSPPPAIHSLHDNGAHAVMCDGSVHRLLDWTGADRVKAMSTIAGGDRIDESPAF